VHLLPRFRRGLREEAVIALLLLVACSTSDPCRGVRDLATSPGGLDLAQSEHPGWGQDDCFQCHQAWRIHRADCLSGADVDAAEIAARGDTHDPSTCVDCHGSNGVERWADTGGAP
jgi:hypothetical protein